MAQRNALLTRKFMAAAAVGLTVMTATTPYAVAETSEPSPLSSSDVCKTSDSLKFDENGKPWIHIDAKTKDQIPVSFDLHVRFDKSAKTEAADKALCLDLNGHVHGIADVVYRHHLLQVNYGDLPAGAPQILRNVAHNLEVEVNKRLTAAGMDVSVTGVALKDVSAPGLTGQQALKMMMYGIKVPTPPVTDKTAEAVSRDGHKLKFSLNVEFQNKAPAFNEHGPDRNAIEREVREIVTETVREQMKHWDASCVIPDEAFIEIYSYNAAQEKVAQDGDSYLLKIDISDIEITPNVQSTAPEAPARCFSHNLK